MYISLIQIAHSAFFDKKLCCRFLLPGKRSPVLLRLGRPPKPLPRNIYTNVPARGSQLCRSNSDCSSVISYDLGDPRNSPAVKRHSSLYFPPQSHRHRTDTIDTARSSGIAMDLGEGMHKGKKNIADSEQRSHTPGHSHQRYVEIIL